MFSKLKYSPRRSRRVLMLLIFFGLEQSALASKAATLDVAALDSKAAQPSKSLSPKETPRSEALPNQTPQNQISPSSTNKSQVPYAGAQMGDAGPFELVSFAKGIEFKDPDSSLKVALRFRMQNRMEALHDLDKSETIGDGQIRRLRLRLNGTAADPRLHFLIQLSFSRDDLEWRDTQFPNIIRDAMVTFQVNPSWSVGFGQGKLPGNRQRVVSSGDLQFSDRSLVNSYFNIGRDMGIQSQWSFLDKSPLIIKGAISTGEGRNQGDPADRHMSYTLRTEWLPLGKFEDNGDYFEGDLAYEETPKLSFGVGSALMDGTSRSNGGNGTYMLEPSDSSGKTFVSKSQHIYFGDLVAKYKGHSLFVEFGQRGLSEPIVSSKQAFAKGWGINTQYGFMYHAKREIAVKYSLFRPDSEVADFYNAMTEWGIVHNFYISGHRIKLQTEAGLRESQSVYARLQFEYGI